MKDKIGDMTLLILPPLKKAKINSVPIIEESIIIYRNNNTKKNEDSNMWNSKDYNDAE